MLSCAAAALVAGRRVAQLAPSAGRSRELRSTATGGTVARSRGPARPRRSPSDRPRRRSTGRRRTRRRAAGRSTSCPTATSRPSPARRASPTTPSSTASFRPMRRGRSASTAQVISTLQGTSATGGRIWFYSPGGIVVGATAVFDVGSLLLTTNDVSNLSTSANGFSATFTGRGVLDVENPDHAGRPDQCA